MKIIKKDWVFLLLMVIFLITFPLYLLLPKTEKDQNDPWRNIKKNKIHFDHSKFYTEPFKSPQDVTISCLECHENAAQDLMKTAHWKWEGEEVIIAGHDKPQKIGKKNLMNNFCISIKGNERTCVSCHAGYGWKDDSFDFTSEHNVDCLICHDWTGTYVKSDYGLPAEGVDLLTVAKSVGYPKRENCGICHNYGGGGMGVKHGDLDASLINPSEDVDVHMGKYNLLCIDCHQTEKHNITGKSFSVSVDHQNSIACTDCHKKVPHYDRRINTHLDHVACQTCHIPTYAKRAPTKVFWDWSKAGDSSRKDDIHTYLKIKGEFIYDQDVTPQYYWFNLKSKRYLMGDKIDPDQVTEMNPPQGDIEDPEAKLWPFKIHLALQPYDSVNNILLNPVTSGEGGYWSEFDWPKALKLGADISGLPFSGEFGFVKTTMHWPISHMTTPKTQALSCCECHTVNGKKNKRIDWERLGYKHDPIFSGGRQSDVGNRKREKSNG